MGQRIVRTLVSEMLRDTFADYDLKHANEVLKGKADKHTPRKPVNLVKTQPTTGQVRDNKVNRPTFQEFMQAVSQEGVMPSVDFQQNVRIELPGDPENGLPIDWEATSKRVRAWLFRFYLEVYGMRPDQAELRDAIEWLRSEAYVWGMGEPSGVTSVNTLDDDAVFVGIRKYCSGLSQVGEQLREQASTAYDDLKSKAKDAGADLKKWPERPSDLSSKLKKSDELLAQLGLVFTNEHTRTGSVWIFERIEVPESVTTGKIPAPSEGEEDDLSA